jgi:ubiquitin
MKINFKTYCQLWDAESDNQIDEIFGKFFGKEPKESEAHKKAKADWLARKQARKEKDDAARADKNKTALARQQDRKDKAQADRSGWLEYSSRPSSGGNAAARGRAAELDWTK